MNDLPRLIVADSSAIINLNASQYAKEILRALPERVIITEIVAGELEDGKSKDRSDTDLLAELEAAGLIEIKELSDSAQRLFEQLVSGQATATLDDGEAATIAYAAEHSLGVILDDHKARRICREHFPEMEIKCSVDLFKHAAVVETMRIDQLTSSVLNALKFARMRVLPEHMEWVIKLIGQSNARACTSLPQRYRYTSGNNI